MDLSAEFEIIYDFKIFQDLRHFDAINLRLSLTSTTNRKSKQVKEIVVQDIK